MDNKRQTDKRQTEREREREREREKKNPTNKGVTVNYLARRHKFIPVTKQSTLFEVVKHLSNGTHRMPVLENGRCVDIVSQSSIVKFLSQNLTEPGMAKDVKVSISAAGIGTSPVLVVSSKSTALATFKVMSKYNLSGIGVVDPTGRFVGNTSGSDLKLFIQRPDVRMLIATPVMDFLSQIRRSVITEKTKSPTISVRGAYSVGKLIGKLAATRIHRLFVASSESGFKPLAVISISDIMKWIVSLDK